MNKPRPFLSGCLGDYALDFPRQIGRGNGVAGRISWLLLSDANATIGEGAKSFDDERDFAGDALVPDLGEERICFGFCRLDVFDSTGFHIPPKRVERGAPERITAKRYRRAFVEFRGGEMHHYAGPLRTRLDELPDDVLPDAFRAAGSSRVEVQEIILA